MALIDPSQEELDAFDGMEAVLKWAGFTDDAVRKSFLDLLGLGLNQHIRLLGAMPETEYSAVIQGWRLQENAIPTPVQRTMAALAGRAARIKVGSQKTIAQVETESKQKVGTRSTLFNSSTSVAPMASDLPPLPETHRLDDLLAAQMHEANLTLTVKNTFFHVGETEVVSDLPRAVTAPVSGRAHQAGFDDTDDTEEERRVPTSRGVDENGNLAAADTAALPAPGMPPGVFLPQDSSGSSGYDKAMPPTSSGDQDWMLLEELPPPFKVQTLSQWLNRATGSTFINWTVDARKLKSNDRLVVSPVFKIGDGSSNAPILPFKMTVSPIAVSESKGGASFKKAGGKGIIQLKCEALREGEHISPMSFRFSAGSGRPKEPLLEAPRGPVTCNFTETGICGLPKPCEVWDFQGVVDDESKTFVITLEVMAPACQQIEFSV